MATPANVRHELANTLIECDGTADETVRRLVEQLLDTEVEWLNDPSDTHGQTFHGHTFLSWLAS